jgi:hypothetical protein
LPPRPPKQAAEDGPPPLPPRPPKQAAEDGPPPLPPRPPKQAAVDEPPQLPPRPAQQATVNGPPPLPPRPAKEHAGELSPFLGLAMDTVQSALASAPGVPDSFTRQTLDIVSKSLQELELDEAWRSNARENPGHHHLAEMGERNGLDLLGAQAVPGHDPHDPRYQQHWMHEGAWR